MEEKHGTAVLSSEYSLGSWISETDCSVGSAGWSKNHRCSLESCAKQEFLLGREYLSGKGNDH